MKLKPWRCKNNHILGIIQVNGNDVTRLLLYRHAVDEKAEQPAEVDLIIGPMVGSMPVHCDICDDVKLWDVSIETIGEWIDNLSETRKLELQSYFEKRKGQIK